MTHFQYILLATTLITSSLSAQKLDPDKKYDVACIGFYNLENLFDTIDTKDVKDTEFTPGGSKLWDSKRYYHKLENMSRVISEMGKKVTNSAPSILGVAEIENKMVLEDLINTDKLKSQNYGIVHYQSPDRRGIDVALLYRKDHFNVASSKKFPLESPSDPNFKSRDQLLVSGELFGEKVHIIVAHWPSRRGGEKRSMPKRILAAQLAKGIIDSLKLDDPKAKVIFMGDLNDDPNSPSVKKYMMATGNKKKLIGDALYNPMQEYYNKGIGTLAWRDSWNLFDQLIMTQSLLHDDPSTFKYYGAKVFNQSYLQQSSGRFKGYPFRTFVGSDFKGGFSDHFPVYLFLIREQDSVN
ncbi:MAG: endonuclease/exonuclease/phosphatase family protein [Flavobacteriales bacterium]|nr:endonuclease/exonuclease/phosphatase family protein [Flavobacteriales bacterium]